MKTKQKKVNWKYISSFICHHMHKKLASKILFAVNEKGINNFDIKNKTIDTVLQYLTKKQHLNIDEKEYIKRLITLTKPKCM